MFRVAKDWNPKQQELREALSRKYNYKEAIRICLELHGIVHGADVSHGAGFSLFDELYNGLGREIFSLKSRKKTVTAERRRLCGIFGILPGLRILR